MLHILDLASILLNIMILNVESKIATKAKTTYMCLHTVKMN